MSSRVLVAHPSAELYGSDRVLLESVVGLIEHGYSVIVTVPTPGPLVHRLKSAGAQVILTPTPVLRKEFLSTSGLARLAGQFLTSAWPGLRLLRRSRPDVVLVNTVTIPLWLVLSKITRVPVICHVHEGESTASRVVKAAIAAPLMLTDAVIANSRFSVGVLTKSISRVESRAEVILNAIEGPPSEVPMRRSPDGPFRVAYFGRLSPRKGVDVAIAAVADLRGRGLPVSLDIVGDVFTGYGWYEAELREQVHVEGLEEIVTFHGFEPSIWSSLSDSDVVVVPSRGDEPFGNTAVESILGGRPVIVSGSSGLLEAAEGYECAQTVKPDDPVALADAIARVRADWSTLITRMAGDVALAQSRHAPARYHREIARIVDDVRARRAGRTTSRSSRPERVAGRRNDPR